MNAPPRTASQLAAALVVDTCVAMVKDEWDKPAPIEGTELSQEQRARLGLPSDGMVMVYELGDAEVFMHFDGPTATVGYTRGDVDKGLSAVDSALKRAYPALKQQRDIEHPRGGKKRLRVYEGDLSPERHCTVEVDYPTSGGAKKFNVRVSAFQRQSKKKGLN